MIMQLTPVCGTVREFFSQRTSQRSKPPHRPQAVHVTSNKIKILFDRIEIITIFAEIKNLKYENIN